MPNVLLLLFVSLFLFFFWAPPGGEGWREDVHRDVETVAYDLEDGGEMCDRRLGIKECLLELGGCFVGGRGEGSAYACILCGCLSSSILVLFSFLCILHHALIMRASVRRLRAWKRASFVINLLGSCHLSGN